MLRQAYRKDFTKEFAMHTERGAALSAAAKVDESLGAALKAQLLKSDLKTMMFKESGPLGAFGTRVRLAYLTGLVSKMVFQEMETVKDIRNMFAHRGDIENFEHSDVEKLFSKLTLLDLVLRAEHPNRKRFAELFARFDLSQRPYYFIATCIMLSVLVDLEAQSLPPVRTPLF
jgi:hypothetical protein